MSLRHCPLVYVFLETCELGLQRETIESGVGLPVLAVETRPAVRHSVVKYDAGTMVLSLNLSSPSRFQPAGSDGLTTVFDVAPAWGKESGSITDAHGHHYIFQQAAIPYTSPVVAELRFWVVDLDATVRFYRDVLGLQLISREMDTASFETGVVTLVFERLLVAVDGQYLRRNTYLLVFHTCSIRRTCSALAAQGLAFKGRNIGSRELGRTIGFDDPSGNRFCLYEPSQESLMSPSGRKIRQIMVGCDAGLPIRHW